jgi:hypothetical protein
MTLWNDNVSYPKRYSPLPPGYRVIQLDSGHFLWTHDESCSEGVISWDRYWVRRCAFAHAEERTKK